MPREIDCPDCGGTGSVCHNCEGDCYDGPHRICESAGDDGNKYCPHCEDGKIKIYTESEVQELIKAERTDLEKLLIYVNPITAPHRHGNKIAKRDLDKLTNLQIEIEHNIRKRREV